MTGPLFGGVGHWLSPSPLLNAIISLGVIVDSQQMNIIQKRRFSGMIGAVIAKRRAGSGFDAYNNHDLKTVENALAEDATYTFPGNVSISGETKGKKAIEALHAKMMEQFPKMYFTVREVFVSNIFALGATNSVAVEWDLTETNREGKEFRNSGVTIFSVKGGKVVATKEYVFNTDILKEAWGEA
jgi:ketosteroid isomerase-like protein